MNSTQFIAGAGLALALFASDSQAADNTGSGSPAPESALRGSGMDSYERGVQQTESEHGAYASGLSEQLLGMGYALQDRGLHEEAVKVFKRGVHLARINYGLYSAEQISLLQGEIASHLATGDYEAADERQFYLYRVQQRSLTSGELRTAALMQQAQWQYNAYQLGLGEVDFTRLLNMWDLYRLALNETVDREGEYSKNLLPPLMGMLRAQYLISGYQVESSGLGGDSDLQARQDQGRFHAYRAQSYKKGNAVIRAIYDVEKAQPEQSPVVQAETQVMLGDWMLWHGERESAQQAYDEALGELSALDDAQQEIERLFGAPQPLPAVEGIHPLPRQAPQDQANVTLEFTVNARGRVVDLERLDETEGLDGRVNRLMRKLRRTPFRPRFEAGEPVTTEKVTRNYAIE